MKKPTTKPGDGTTMTIAASVPVSIVAEGKKRSGKSGFSRFVTAALQRELLSRSLQEIVEDVVRESGPLDPREIAAALKLIRS